MFLALALVVVWLVQLYGLVGLVFALLFLPRSLARLDPGVVGAPKAMKLLILPGVAALWPLFAWRWMSGVPAPVERSPHRARAGAR